MTVAGTNNQNSGSVLLSGAGVLQTNQTGGFGTGLFLASSGAVALSISNGTLGLLNDLSVTFGTGGTGVANGYTFNQTGNAAIKVDNLTYPGSGPPDSTTGQTLTIGSGTVGAADFASLCQRPRLQPQRRHFGHHGGLVHVKPRGAPHEQYGQRYDLDCRDHQQLFRHHHRGPSASAATASAVTIVGSIGAGATNAFTLGLTSSGSGLVVLTGTNAYNGLTNVTKGTLALGQIAGVGATLQFTSAVTVSNAAFFGVTPGVALTTSNSIGGALILNNNSNFSMADGYANTFTVGGNGGAATSVLAPSGSGLNTNLTFDVGGGTSDVLAISGSAYVGSATAAIQVNPIGAVSPVGTYDIITATSGGLGSNFTLAGGGFSIIAAQPSTRI